MKAKLDFKAKLAEMKKAAAAAADGARATPPPSPPAPEPPLTPTQHKAEHKLQTLRQKEPAVRKIVRKAAILADLITPADLEASARVVREAKEATTQRYDKDAKAWVTEPDHKTRLAAAAFERAHTEGLPVARHVILTSSFKDPSELLSALNESGEAAKAMATLAELGINVELSEDEGEIIEAELVQENGESGEDVPHGSDPDE